MSCQRIRDDLAVCVLRSDCYKSGQGDVRLVSSASTRTQSAQVKQCLKEHIDELPDECRYLRQALYDCKRGMVRAQADDVESAPIFCQLDMRKRFRGIDPGMNKQVRRANVEE